MTKPFTPQTLKFFLTPPSPCPYLEGREERKIFARLETRDGPGLNDALTQAGFRRSQDIVYRPACEACDSCLSARVPVASFVPKRGHRRTLRHNTDLSAAEVLTGATPEQYALLADYLDARHQDGGMNGMSYFEYVAMVEETVARTRLFEYRLAEDGPDGHAGQLVAVALTDELADGLSMVYAYFNPRLAKRSLGAFMILDHIKRAGDEDKGYVYLGYWVPGSPKMDYKARFRPLEVLTGLGWASLEDR